MTTPSLIVNGKATSTAAANLASLLTELGFRDVRVATALNGAFVPEVQRATTRLTAGDRIEIVSARQGG
jgi:sulfur carrier protein